LVLLDSEFVLGEPLQQPVAGDPVDCVLVYFFVSYHVVGQGYAAFAVDPGAEVGGVE